MSSHELFRPSIVRPSIGVLGRGSASPCVGEGMGVTMIIGRM